MTALLLLPCTARAADAGCPAPATVGPAVSAVWSDDGVLLLADGRRLAAEGIVLPSRLRDRALVAAARAAAEGVLVTATIRPAPVPLDRHGRLAGGAVLVRADDEADEDLATVLLRAGAGLARPEAAAGADCTAARLAAEAQARQNRRGLWTRPDAALEAASERELLRHAGLFVVAAGRVRAAGATRDRIYLNFGPHWREDFTVVFRKEDFATILGDSLDPAMLRGSMIEVRGAVREDGGPAIQPRSKGEFTVRAEGPARNSPARGRR